MTKNWAIAIGINQYDLLQPLKYAQQDAQAVADFLHEEAGFDKILLFSDSATKRDRLPNRTNLRRSLRELVEMAKMSAGDNFWFFFSGHGMRHTGRDFLMPVDGNPQDIEDTAIPISFITDLLRQCGADNVVLILDACRNQNDKGGEGIGTQTAEVVRQTGVISIFSCSPNEYSYEIDNLQQGAFTKALLEGLGIQGQCATVERLNQYLTWRVPELNRQNGKLPQTPYTIAEPVTKSHLILMPRYATVNDIATLKNEAYRAMQIDNNFALAEQLWIRLLAASSGQDLEAIKALQKIALLEPKSKNVSFGTQRIANIPVVIMFIIGLSISLSAIYPAKIKELIAVNFGNEKTHPTMPTNTPSPITSTNNSNTGENKNRAPGEFYCAVDKGVPVTKVWHSQRGSIIFIRWVSTYFNSTGDTPQIRCEKASQRLQRFQQNGILNYIIPGNFDGYPALCASRSMTSQVTSCTLDNLIVILELSQNPNEVIEKILEINTNRSSNPVEL